MFILLKMRIERNDYMPIELKPLPLLARDLSDCTPVNTVSHPIPLDRILTPEEMKELEREE